MLRIDYHGQEARVWAPTSAEFRIGLFSADSPSGPWTFVGGESFLIEPGHKFFRAQVNPLYVRFEGVFVAAQYIALRLPAMPNGSAITTASGFRLEFHAPWAERLAIYKIVDGPATLSVTADYERLFRELWDDARTDFVGPVTPTFSMNDVLCFMGATDEILFRNRSQGYSEEDLARFDLAKIYQSGSFIVVKWLKPKSHRLETFLQILKQAGFVNPEPNALGCAS